MTRPMTPDERLLALSLSPYRVTYPVGSPTKRTAYTLAREANGDEPRIGDWHRGFLLRTVRRYRAQIPWDIRQLAARMAADDAAAPRLPSHRSRTL